MVNYVTFAAFAFPPLHRVDAGRCCKLAVRKKPAGA
jgi:hypothetical protein